MSQANTTLLSMRRSSDPSLCSARSKSNLQMLGLYVVKLIEKSVFRNCAVLHASVHEHKRSP